jgi:hypothetical protein
MATFNGTAEQDFNLFFDLTNTVGLDLKMNLLWFLFFQRLLGSKIPKISPYLLIILCSIGISIVSPPVYKKVALNLYFLKR